MQPEAAVAHAGERLRRPAKEAMPSYADLAARVRIMERPAGGSEEVRRAQDLRRALIVHRRLDAVNGSQAPALVGVWWLVCEGGGEFYYGAPILFRARGPPNPPPNKTSFSLQNTFQELLLFLLIGAYPPTTERKQR